MGIALRAIKGRFVSIALGLIRHTVCGCRDARRNDRAPNYHARAVRKSKVSVALWRCAPALREKSDRDAEGVDAAGMVRRSRVLFLVDY